MRLLNVTNPDSLYFVDFREDQRPKYVIASHRWVEGGEVTLQDVQNKRNTDKSGYKKIVHFAKYVKEHVPTVEWLWVDTCCINKHNAAELSKSLNLMFDWYQNAVLCIAYLADVEAADDKNAFKESEWFQRGWTLQELLAPRLVVFVTKTWQVIGNKGASTYIDCGTPSGLSFEENIATITGLPERILHNYAESSGFRVEEKLTWIEGRTTTEPEDMVYSLYGILGVRPGANYGEGYQGARQRLLAAIHQADTSAAERADHFQDITAWLSPPDPWTNHHSARQLHNPRSGSWLLRSNLYKTWKGSLTRHLWMSGKAGCGKTILCSTAVEDVKAYCEDQPNVGYAVFYFSFSDDRKQRLADLLCSLVAQLGWKGPALSMLQQAFNKPNRSALGAHELEKILLICFEAYQNVFLLLDALDECPEDNDARQGVFECLIRVSQKAQNVKVFATSRELPDIRILTERLGASPLPIATHSVDEDIRQYVGTQISLDPRLSRLGQKMKALIEETVSTKADGMFRWAFCQLQELKKLKSTRPKFIKDALTLLPATLDETYERMLIGIEDKLRTDALTLLRWVAYAKSPPSLGELVDATVIDLTARGAVEVEDRPGLDDTLEILSGLVTIVVDQSDDQHSDSRKDIESRSLQVEDPEIEPTSRLQRISADTKVRLAHFSVKEYLESSRILRSDAGYFYLKSAREHGVLSQCCLVYLLHYSSSSEKLSDVEDLATFPLLRYAAESWFYHAALQDSTDAAHAVELLSNKQTLLSWLLVHRPDETWTEPFKPLDETAPGLYYASFTGHQSVVTELLTAGADVNAQGGRYGNALQAASVQGHDKVVQMLMDAGADVHAQGGFYGNTLQAASVQGHDKVVQMLIDAGADVHAQGGFYGNALQAASGGGQDKVVQMLMDAGADVHVQGGRYGNALQAASVQGHDKVVQMLMDAGADVHAQGGSYGNALQAASGGGHDKVVQMLIDAGADVHAQGGHYGNALQAASGGGHDKVVQMLMDAGADVHAQGGFYGSALQAASEGGHDKVVQMLIDAGADVHAQGGFYGNALQAASEGGHDKVVQMLIDAGADVHAQGGHYGNALQAASEGGHDKVVQMLIDAGADVHAQGGHYGNALQAASGGGHDKVVQMLMDAGADVHAQGGHYGNALQAASEGGHDKVVQMLIDAGADVHAQGGFYGNALQAASEGGHDKVVQMLIDAGADVHAQGGLYGNALQAASEGGHDKVVQILMDFGP